jgi:hypothetical protein
MNKKLDTQTETEVVAYIARGDSYDDIINVFTQRGFTLNKTNLTHIKQRNSEALTFMQNAITEKQLSHASSILRKSRQLLENKLDIQLDVQHELDQLKADWKAGTYDFDEYINLSTVILKRQLTASELNSITKESFNQSQVEAGKPTAITESPAQARKNLQIILDAIAAGDDKGAIDALFLDA